MFFLRCSTTLLNFAKLELTNAEITASVTLDLSLTREEVPIGFLAWICSALRHGKRGGAWHPSECRRQDSASIRKENCSRDLDPELYFFPSSIFPRESVKNDRKTEREAVRSFFSAAFYPILPIQSFVRRECSRLTRFSSEIADETRRERHVSLAREGWQGNFHASPFFLPVWTRSKENFNRPNSAKLRKKESFYFHYPPPLPFCTALGWFLQKREGGSCLITIFQPWGVLERANQADRAWYRCNARWDRYLGCLTYLRIIANIKALVKRETGGLRSCCWSFPQRC